MAAFSRSITVSAFQLRAGDLVRILRTIQKELFGRDGARDPVVMLTEKRPDGTTLDHGPRGGLARLEPLCAVEEGTEVSIRWSNTKKDDLLYVSMSHHHPSGGVSIRASATDAAVVSRCLDQFKAVFGPSMTLTASTIEVDAPMVRIPGGIADGWPQRSGTRSPEPGVEIRRTRVAGIYGIIVVLVAVAGGLLTLWWKSTHPGP